MGRRAAKCVDFHAHDHEERGEEGPFVAGHRAPRRAISPRPRTGHPPEHRGMGAAVEQAKGKRGGGGGGGAAPPLGVHAGAGWAELHLVLTAGDIGRHSRGRAVSARLRTTSAASPCSLGRSARLTVRCSSALKRIRALAWSRLRDEAVSNRCAEVVDSSAALRSVSPQTSVRWSIPVGRAPDVVSGKSSKSLSVTRLAGGHGRKGTTYPTSSASFVRACSVPGYGPPELGWPVCAGPLAAAQSLRLRPRATDEACGSLPTVGAMGGHRGTRASG